MNNATIDREHLGVIIVDHGSRRLESNAMLLDVVAMFRAQNDYSIVEPAHMEIAEPSIATAMASCVEQGAKLVIVHPYFLLPGRHWNDDIPRLAAKAAHEHVGMRFLVTAPLGLHNLMGEVINHRINHCLLHASGSAEACDLCAGTDKCQIR